VSDITSSEELPLAISAPDAIARVRSGMRMVDVREQHEWDGAHAPESVLLPMSQLQARVQELPADQPLLVLCHSGARSERVAVALRDAGYNAATVTGGILAWQAAGGAVVTSGPGQHA
jgi:rhodanese-related sulfurtransferase